MTVDWKDLTMTFSIGNAKVILRGDPSLSQMEVSLKMLTKTWQSKDLDFLIDFRAMETKGRQRVGGNRDGRVVTTRVGAVAKVV